MEVKTVVGEGRSGTVRVRETSGTAPLTKPLPSTDNAILF